MSPVKQDVPGANCGDAVIAAKQVGCYPSLILDTLIVQYCCGSGDCAAGGVAPVKRDSLGKSGAWSMVSLPLTSS
jgi:hypothetical protein